MAALMEKVSKTISGKGNQHELYILRRKSNAGCIYMQHTYFIAWPCIMKIGQIDVLFAVTRSKMKHLVTYKDSFNDINDIM